MKIGSRQIDSDHPPYIIAEIGVNHDGSVDRAVDLVEAAKRAGADAIKLQLFKTDLLLSRAAKLAIYQQNTGEADAFEMLRSLELSVEQMLPIVERAHSRRLHAIATVFSVELLDAARKLSWDAFKVASPDIVHRPLLESLMKTGLPLIVSAGASTLDEVERASHWLADHPHLLMQCVSAYPTPEQSAAFGGRIAMERIAPEAIGYSDHTTAIDTGALAVASGARLLEKHLTHDRSAKGPDHAASLDPDQFAEYVRLAHRAFAMMGKPQKFLLEIEQDVRQVSRQSLTSTCAMRAGHALQRQDVTIKRPGVGIPPWRLDEVIGRKLVCDIAADMPLTEEHIRSGCDAQ